LRKKLIRFLLTNLPDIIDPDSGYPKCPNHSHELTTKDFVKVANATVEAFGKALILFEKGAWAKAAVENPL
jgi:hypothetical protein